MNKRLYVTMVVFLLVALFATAQSSRTIQVDVSYTGSGTVDSGHKIYVSLWDSPDFPTGGGGPPVAIMSVASKTGTVTFPDVQKSPTYVSAAYDPTGAWDGQSGPPPAGASLGMYSKKPPTPEPIHVDSGKTAKAKFSFDDSVKSQ